ncbi:MAG: Zn-dependent oligopeptidase [Methanomicrobiaceae archaeon]|nr:Zn-dependent oligopeptidase [Methanomicrobiaceae archaeon]
MAGESASLTSSDSQIPVRMQYLPGEIPVLYKNAEMTANASLNAITAIPPGERTFENTVLAFDRAMSDYNDYVNPLTLMGDLSPDPEVLDEGLCAADSYSAFCNHVLTRSDLYNAMSGQIPDTPVKIRLYNKIMDEFERSGLGLSEEKSSHIGELKTELHSLELLYNSNLNSDNSTIEFSEEDLKGLSESDLDSFERTDDESYRIKLNYPNYEAVMTYADSSETRERMYTAYNNVCASENTKLLEGAIELRTKIAQETGYPTWAEYVISDRMAKNASSALLFLNALKEPLSVKKDSDYKALLAVKKSIDPDSEEVFRWDIMYLKNILLIEDYNFDEEELKEYFPLDNVLNGIFNTTGKLFGIKFVEIYNTSVWSPEVRLFEVSNSSDGKVLGYLYIDAYTRDGKYTGTAAAEVIAGREINGTYNTPVAVIIANLAPPREDKPSLLTLTDIWRLFHETGHSLHVILSESPYGTLSSFKVDFDFVEMPSQTLEEWAYDEDILKSMSGRYDNSSEKIPDSLLKSAIASKDVNKGFDYSSQLADSLIDLYYHNSKTPVNTTEVWYDTFEDVFEADYPDNIRPQASFGHLMGGYDAGYYSYLWSKVYALDIDEKFWEYGMTNETLGLKLRYDIYSKGNTEDNMAILENFLGEKPGVDSLYEFMGIEV